MRQPRVEAAATRVGRQHVRSRPSVEGTGAPLARQRGGRRRWRDTPAERSAHRTRRRSCGREASRRSRTATRAHGAPRQGGCSGGWRRTRPQTEPAESEERDPPTGPAAAGCGAAEHKQARSAHARGGPRRARTRPRCPSGALASTRRSRSPWRAPRIACSTSTATCCGSRSCAPARGAAGPGSIDGYALVAGAGSGARRLRWRRPRAPERARQVPVALAQQRHRRRQQDRPDHRRVEQDARRRGPRPAA